MKSIDGRNNVKIYNLNAGKSLPDWLTSRKRRKLLKRNADMQMKIELLQDFNMPDICSRIKVSEDGQYVIATGTYKPTLKCYDVSSLSLKFERCMDSDIVEVLLLTDDYKKMVFMQEERFIEFHNQGGRWYRTRIPKFGRDMAYHYPSCDLYMAAAGKEIYRMNLWEGKYVNSIMIDSDSANKCVFNPVHYLLTVGTNDGIIEAWDPRSRQRVGRLDCTLSMVREKVQLPYYKTVEELGITSLAYRDGLNLAVGTYTGHVLLYDIRSNKPYLVKDKLDDSPVIDLEFHPDQDIVYSLTKDSLNIWDSNNGKSYTCIESDFKYNDLCTVPGSGMVFLAAESPKMEIYFIPSLGPAPKWCGHLDALVEELEEEDIPAAYDDYKFVTEQELNLLGLESLIGTNCLRAVMHGYYLDFRLYNKAKSAVNLLDKESIVKQKVKQKIAEEKEKKILKKKKSAALPNINQEPYMKLKEEAERGTGEKAAIAKDVLQDPRFAALFSKSEFGLDKEAESYRLIQPMSGKSVEKFKQMGDSDGEDEKEKSSKSEIEEAPSDSDSIVSASEMEDEEEEALKVQKSVKKKSKLKSKKKEPRFDSIRLDSASGIPHDDFSKMDSTRNGNNLLFLSMDAAKDLDNNWEEKKKSMTLAELLEEEEEDDQEEDDDDVQENGFGSREMKVHFGASSKKFEMLRQQQRDHHKVRREVARKTNHLRGKIRMNKPYF